MRVVKIGGRAQADPLLPKRIRAAWDAAPGSICIVHGGGDEITAMQKALGREAAFVGGRRVTSSCDLELLRMVLSGAINKRIVNSLVVAGVPAVGVSGEDSALIGSEIIDAATLGFAGQAVRIEQRLLTALLDGGFLPVISPVGYDLSSGSGGTLNVNGDDAAAAIAVSLAAHELLLVADVEGVRDGNGGIISSLDLTTARELTASGIAAGGMCAKLDSAAAAVRSGVGRVRITDLEGLSDPLRGTLVIQDEEVAVLEEAS